MSLQHPKEPADLGAGPPPSAREPSPPWRSTGHARTGNRFESTAAALESGCAQTRSRPGIEYASAISLSNSSIILRCIACAGEIVAVLLEPSPARKSWLKSAALPACGYG